jgi:farnesyl diphosphate synthase
LTDQNFAARLAGAGKDVDAVLAQLLESRAVAGEIARPERLMAAMRHATLAGGKRLRPFLVIEAARIYDVEGAHVLRAAAAIECIHCYSLVHDDLPAMDDDDPAAGAANDAPCIRRGDGHPYRRRPADAGFRHPRPTSARRGMPRSAFALVGTLARASGVGGMAGGQMLDLEAEGRFAADGQAARARRHRHPAAAGNEDGRPAHRRGRDGGIHRAR